MKVHTLYLELYILRPKGFPLQCRKTQDTNEDNAKIIEPNINNDD